MKAVILTLALGVVAGAHADEWVSVGAARAVAPASSSATIDSSSRAGLAAPVNIPASTASNDLVGELALQMEQMQQEIAVLRGRLEEQDHQLKRMRDEQQQRYLDLDRRLSVLLSTPAAAPAPTSGPVSAAPVTDTPSAQSAAEDYQQAMTLVREKQFPEASAAFERFIKAYPQDPLVVNALYWSGEVWLVLGDLEKALQQFRRVVNDHAGHDKEADASYKVGVTLHRQGNVAEAKVWLQRVIDRFSGKADGTVRLARSYLDKL